VFFDVVVGLGDHDDSSEYRLSAVFESLAAPR